MDSTQKIISFCTGYGGIELGLKLAGLNVRTVAYVEIEAFACANLVAKIEQGKMDAAPIWTNLKTFDGRPFRDRVHGIIGGYPCQPFSNAGKRKGTEDPRHLFPYICEHIRTIRPLWCFFENVGGHLNLGFNEVYKSLRDMGYSVEAGLFTASEIGAPHKRERLFILGYSEGERCGEAGTDSKRTSQRTTGTSAVANTDIRQSRSTTIAEPRETKQPESCDDSGERAGLVDAELPSTTRQRQYGDEPALPTEPARDNTSNIRWPARPGQPQYEWEEPRTVKSGMGRTVDGFKTRVDQLRLLGNGVVPQTAALAWKTLAQKLSKEQ